MRDLLELYETRGLAARLTELHELVVPTLDELASNLGYDRAFVVLIDGEHWLIEGAVGVNVPDELIGELRNPRSEQRGPLREAFASGKPLRVDDALRDGRIGEADRVYYADCGMLAFAVVPLLP